MNARPRWSLTALQFDVLTDVLRLPRLPSPIEIRAHGDTGDERAHLRHQVRDELSALGWYQRGRLDADLDAALRTVASPQRWVDSVWLPHLGADQPVRVVVATAGSVVVRIVQYPDDRGAAELDVVGANAIAAAVVTALPAASPGRRPAMSVPRLGQRDDDLSDRGVLVSSARVRPGANRAALVEILHGDHDHAGQIAANGYDGGRERRSSVLRWCDMPGDGRYGAWSERASDGREHTVLEPADVATLIGRVERLLREVAVR